jgi:hypothetical protein
MPTHLITRGLGEDQRLVGGGFGAALSAAVAAVVEETRRRRSRGRKAIDDFEEFFIRASLVRVNNKNIENKKIQSAQKVQILSESDISIAASGVRVNYINSVASRIVITANRILKG